MACDRCWRLKDEDCAQCRKQNAECTWTRTKKPTPAPDKDYVLYLEDRTKEIEQRLKQLLPGINVKREIDNLLEISHGVVDNSSSSISNDATTSQTSTSRTRDNPTLTGEHNLSLISSPFTSRLLQTIRLTDVTSAPPTAHGDSESDSTWKSNPHDPLPQYYGSSSTEFLVHNAELYLNQAVGESAHLRPEFWRPSRAESHAYANDDPHILANLQAELPPEDLLLTLIDGYFERVNLVLPILHRPLFESQLCARWCEDPRVLDSQCRSELSAGYRWFRSVYKNGIDAIYRPSLVNAQFLVLSLVFLLGTSLHDIAWLFAAKASRMFEVLGAHRRKQSHTLADELLKRSFRCHFILDRFASSSTGRPSAFRNIDIDVDDVIEIDDVYWTPELNALPPHGPPESQAGSFQLATLNHASSLCTMIGQAIQTVFAPVSLKMRIGLGSPQGEEWISRNLNQQLNRWAASVPINLRLPNPEHFARHPVSHLHLMVTLWTSYCYAAIYINRPFITSQVPKIAATSFHNCRQAAHQCAQMVHAYYEIPTALPLECSTPGIFSSAMVLIIDLIVNSHPGRLEEGAISRSPDYSAAANERDLKRCSAALRRLEKVWNIAGRLNDVMKGFQEFWSSRLSAQPTASTESAQPTEGVETHDPRMIGFDTPENLGPTGLYAQQPSSISVPSPLSGFSDFEMGIPNFPPSETQSVANPTGVPNEPLDFPYDNGLLSGEWMFNLEDIMAPCSESTTYDLASLPPELERDWNDTMENALRLRKDEPRP
ncbi:hypothetical protein FRC11_010272 [Ceratobasidium sp. 423]|nr:hypothetical protein FRC11_010272 [Ceratobasidium sp. 423]